MMWGRGTSSSIELHLHPKKAKILIILVPFKASLISQQTPFMKKKKLGRDSPSILGWRTDNILWQYLKQRGYEELWDSFQMHFYFISEEKVKNLPLIINRECAAVVSNGRGRLHKEMPPHIILVLLSDQPVASIVAIRLLAVYLSNLG